MTRVENCHLNKASHNIKDQTNEYGTLWVPWTSNLTAVQLLLNIINASDIMTLSEIFDANFESAKIIAEIEQQQHELFNMTLEIEQSNAKLDILGGFLRFITDPLDKLRLPLIIAGSAIGALFIGYLSYRYCYKDFQEKKAAMNVMILKLKERRYKTTSVKDNQEKVTFVPLNNIMAEEKQPLSEKGPLPTAPFEQEEEQPGPAKNNVTAVPPMMPDPYQTWINHMRQITNNYPTTINRDNEPSYSYINNNCYK